MNEPTSAHATPDASPGLPSQAELNGVCPLPHLGVIQVAGDDAANFLHNQLTQDFAQLSLTEARLAALCSAKGRMQASFIGFKCASGDILLVCSQDLLTATLKRLSMFVLRAKAKLTDATAVFTVWGLAGRAVADNAGDAAFSVWGMRELGGASVVGLYPAPGNVPRALWVAPAGTPDPVGEPLALDLWNWSEVESGVATISATVAEAFVPQMLNYESVGGVNFKKGCYPGQEVVARSQFRGTLKRRAYIVHSEAPLAAGDDVFHRSDAEANAGEPCGTVVQAAPAPGGGFDAIVSMQVAAAKGGTLSAGAPDGPTLRLHPLPYQLLADI
ncbi:MAG: folate-binding protein [Burkholderiales bacterium]